MSENEAYREPQAVEEVCGVEPVHHAFMRMERRAFNDAEAYIETPSAARGRSVEVRLGCDGARADEGLPVKQPDDGCGDDAL